MQFPDQTSDADSIDRPLIHQFQIKTELMRLVTAVRDAEEAFDALDNHTDPARRELQALLTRLRLGNKDFRNKLPLQYHRPGLRFTAPELTRLAEMREWICSTPAGQAVREIVSSARNRYPNTEVCSLIAHPIELSFTDSELVDLADAWAELPLDFETKLNAVKTIHSAAKQRQLVQSSFSLIRPARAFIESAQRNATRSGSPKKFTKEEIDLANASHKRLYDSENAREARSLLDEALDRYDKTLATARCPIGVLLAVADLRKLNELRDRALASLENDLHQLRLQWNQATTAIRVLSSDPIDESTAPCYVLRFDGSLSATTLELSGLQFWCEFLLESYYLPLSFNVVTKPTDT